MSVAITSRQNPWFKRVRDALQEHRDEIVVEGPKFVADAVAAGWKPVATFHRSQVAGRGSQGAFAFSADVFDSLADTKSPQNLLALFERPTFSLSSVLGPRVSVVVALDGVQDPGNVGTIVRLAAAFDCAGVLLLPGSADAYSPKAIRASVGAVLSVPIANATAADLIRSGLPMFAADARGGSASSLPADAIIVFGNEGRGVSDEIRAHATPIAIPISPRVESLNVAAAAAILLAKTYEARRGR
jgi:TrmH family RNA methyltransferase